MNEVHTLSHSTWNCKYHIVFVSKYQSRKKTQSRIYPTRLRVVSNRLRAPNQTKRRLGIAGSMRATPVMEEPPRFTRGSLLKFVFQPDTQRITALVVGGVSGFDAVCAGQDVIGFQSNGHIGLNTDISCAEQCKITIADM